MSHDHHQEHAGHDHGHSHHVHGGGHAHSHAAHASERKLFWALLLTGGFMFAAVAGALTAGSLALLADPAHMLTHAASLRLAMPALLAANPPVTTATTRRASCREK